MEIGILVIRFEKWSCNEMCVLIFVFFVYRKVKLLIVYGLLRILEKMENFGMSNGLKMFFIEDSEEGEIYFK